MNRPKKARDFPKNMVNLCKLIKATNSCSNKKIEKKKSIKYFLVNFCKFSVILNNYFKCRKKLTKKGVNGKFFFRFFLFFTWKKVSFLQYGWKWYTKNCFEEEFFSKIFLNSFILSNLDTANIDTGMNEIWPKYVKTKQIQNFHRKSLSNFDEIKIFD